MFFAFYLLVAGKITTASVLLIVGTLTKLQAVYFVPLFVIYAIRYFPLKQWLRGLFYGCLTFVIIWLPFVVLNKNLLLPFNIYLNGSASYPVINVQAFNLWGAIDPRSMAYVTSIHKNILFGIPFSTLNYIILICVLTITLTLILVNRENLPFAGLIYTISIFTFTMSQHERYELTTLPFLFLILFLNLNKNDKSFFKIWIAIDFIIFLNMAYVYTCSFGVLNYSVVVERTLSIFSVAISTYTIILCTKQIIFFKNSQLRHQH
ncbi:hypothetical protein LROSL1_0920 [Furfurilactobacillus rossiae]|nr:hypothetical protein LROSL1_0920 [Furfurilactobacillus rossiae]